MIKVRINGKVYEWDPAHAPLHEAIAVESALKIRFTQYQQELRSGKASARVMGAFAWLVLRRAGQDVSWADIESGKLEINELDFEDEAETAGPDPSDPTVLAPAGTPGTAPATSASSRKSSGTRPGRSAS